MIETKFIKKDVKAGDEYFSLESDDTFTSATFKYTIKIKENTKKDYEEVGIHKL